MTDLETRLLAAGAMIDGMTAEAWVAMLTARGDDLSARAHAIAGYPEEITEAHALAAEERAALAQAAREAAQIADEEAQAWAEHDG